MVLSIACLCVVLTFWVAFMVWFLRGADHRRMIGLPVRRRRYVHTKALGRATTAITTMQLEKAKIRADEHQRWSQSWELIDGSYWRAAEPPEKLVPLVSGAEKKAKKKPATGPTGIVYPSLPVFTGWYDGERMNVTIRPGETAQERVRRERLAAFHSAVHSNSPNPYL